MLARHQRARSLPPRARARPENPACWGIDSCGEHPWPALLHRTRTPQEGPQSRSCAQRRAARRAIHPLLERSIPRRLGKSRRRRFLGTATMAVAARHFGAIACAKTRSAVYAAGFTSTWINSSPVTDREFTWNRRIRKSANCLRSSNEVTESFSSDEVKPPKPCH